MEIRTAAPEAAYVSTGIAKVAETPLEGSDNSAPQTFGPFPTTPTSPIKSPNSKGYTVRFEDDQRTDPIEKAIDSIFLFIDDVRESGSTARGESGCMGVVTENMDVTKTLEHVTDGLCRNPCADPCVESFGQMQPPVDLMLNVQSQDEKREEPEAEPSAEGVPMEESLLKENSVKDLTASANEEEPKEEEPKEEEPKVEEPKVEETKVEEPKEEEPKVEEPKEEEAKEETPKVETPKEDVPDDEAATDMAPEQDAPKAAAGPETTMPTYTPVETISDKMRTMVPEDTLQLVMDAFILKTGEVKPNAEDLTVKEGVDSDPVVEAIDRLIMFFDDIQDAVMNQKISLLVGKMTQDLKASLFEKRNNLTDLDETDPSTIDGSTLSEDTMKTANTTMRVKGVSLQMDPQEYAEAVASAAELLSTAAPGTDLSKYSKEELHKQALERIMSERPELEDGFTEYKTEEMILEELMQDAEQTIMKARGQEPTQAEKLVVLGHSGTLTPIPEADEASAGTPASDLIEQGVIKGTVPEVPLVPVEEKEEQPTESVEPEQAQAPEVPEKPTESEPEQVAEPTGTKDTTEVAEKHEDGTEPAAQKGTSEADDAGVTTESPVETDANAPPAELEEESKEVVKAEAERDPIIAIIDQICLYFDGFQLPQGCEGCIGSSATEEGTPSKEDSASDLKLELKEFKKPIDTRGQKMLEEAMKLVQEAKKEDDNATTEALDAIRCNEFEPDQTPSAATELAQKLAATFDEAKKANDPNKFVVRGIEMTDCEKNRAIAALVEAAFEESDKLRRALNSAVDHPGMKGKERDSTMVTPEMSADSDKQQGKVEFEIPELMKQSQDPYIAWEGDDSELMASINADRKLSEMEHENIFRDVSKGLQESSGGIITRNDNPIFSIYKAPAFTEGNSGSAELPEDRLENPARAALKVLCATESISCGDSQTSGEATEQPAVVASPSGDAAKAREMGKKFPGWSLSKKREETLRTQAASPTSV